jgi:regulatory protein
MAERTGAAPPEARDDAVAGDRLQHAVDLVYRYLGHRDRTVLEVRRHLEGKEVEPSIVELAITDVAEAGYLDDARYARRFTEDRRNLDRWGDDRIERKLQSVGIDRALIAAALARRDGETELEAAVALLQRRFPVVPETPKDRDRALGMLVRKGYDLELAYDAIRAYGRS